jgi:hypothetical protein
VLLLAILGCGGNDDTGTHSGDPGGCLSIVTEPLGSVPATEWDPDLGPAMETYDGLAGRWTAETDCGLGRIGLKFVNRAREELEVVREPYPTSLPCGCDNDPDFGADSAYAPLALFTDFEFYVETWDDPGVEGQNVISAGGLFDASAPFQVRACGRQSIDPYLGSEWDALTTFLRVTGGTLGGTVLLSKDSGETSACALSDFVLVEAL